MMLYKNMKAIVDTPDGNRDFFDTVVEVLQGNISASFFLKICLYYVRQTSIDRIKEISFALKKPGVNESCRNYSRRTLHR